MGVRLTAPIFASLAAIKPRLRGLFNRVHRSEPNLPSAARRVLFYNASALFLAVRRSPTRPGLQRVVQRKASLRNLSPNAVAPISETGNGTADPSNHNRSGPTPKAAKSSLGPVNVPVPVNVPGLEAHAGFHQAHLDSTASPRIVPRSVCRLSSVVEQRFRKPQVWGSNPQGGSVSSLNREPQMSGDVAAEILTRPFTACF